MSQTSRYNSVLKAFRYIWQSSATLTVCNILLAVVKGVMPLVLLYITKLVIDQLAHIGELQHDKLWTLLAIATGVYLLNQLLTIAAQLLRDRQADYLGLMMMNLLHEKAVKLDLAHYENPEHQDKLHRARQDAPYRPQMILNDILAIVQNTTSLLVVGVLVAMLHWGIALTLIVFAVPAVWFRMRYARMFYDWRRKNTETERKTGYFSHILTTEYFTKELRMFDLGSFFTTRYNKARLDLEKEQMRLQTRRAISESLMQIVSVAAIFSIYVYIAWQAIEGRLSVGSVVLYFLAFQRSLAFAKQVSDSVSSLLQNNLFLANFHEFLGIESTANTTVSVENFDKPLAQAIQLNNIVFGYPNKPTKVFDGISLSIPVGKTVAIVGTNGAGKTTLVKLLCGLYKPESGTITADGRDIQTIAPQQWRQRLSVVFQDYGIYSLTARENITLGNTQKPYSEQQLHEAAQKSGIHETLSALPKGYDTLLGRVFDGSSQLSVGQWQRVALARAFFRDSEVVILDEPTSAMDAATEYDIFSKFRQLAQGKTTLLISHRFSTVKMADYIYVIDDSRVVEQGSHDQLMVHDGVYARLFRLQADSYK